MRRNSFVSVAFALILFFLCFSSSVLADGMASTPVFEQGNDFENLVVLDKDGNVLDISDLSGRRKIIIFTWEQCRDCIAEYDNYSILVSLYDDQDVDIIFIWKDSIPANAVADAMFGSTKHYVTQDMKRYTDWVPAYYWVDEHNSIKKKTIELKWVVEYLSGVFKPNKEALTNWMGSKLIFFTVEGCTSCQSAQAQIDMVFAPEDVHTVQCGKAEPKENVDQYDPYSIYAYSLDINLFPAFAYLYQDEIIIEDTVDKVLSMGNNYERGGN